MASTPVAQPSIPPPPESLAEQFHRLAAAWHQAVAHHSSSRIRYNHPAYREIIRLGPAAIPLLLHDLETKRRHWFVALEEITGVNPVPEGDRGVIDKMAEAWLRWGKENGYQW